jgi:hypothetical protein
MLNKSLSCAKYQNSTNIFLALPVCYIKKVLSKPLLAASSISMIHAFYRSKKKSYWGILQLKYYLVFATSVSEQYESICCSIILYYDSPGINDTEKS